MVSRLTDPVLERLAKAITGCDGSPQLAYRIDVDGLGTRLVAHLSVVHRSRPSPTLRRAAQPIPDYRRRARKIAATSAGTPAGYGPCGWRVPRVCCPALSSAGMPADGRDGRPPCGARDGKRSGTYPQLRVYTNRHIIYNGVTISRIAKLRTLKQPAHGTDCASGRNTQP
jgi:hypothetical protein